MHVFPEFATEVQNHSLVLGKHFQIRPKNNLIKCNRNYIIKTNIYGYMAITHTHNSFTMII